MQDLAKISFKRSIIKNRLEKYISFNINIKLFFMDSFQFLSSSLDGLVKTLSKTDFKLLSQEFDSDVLNLV